MSDFKAQEVKKALAEHLKNPPSDSVCYYFMLYMEITDESKTFENFVTRIDEEEIHGSWDFLKIRHRAIHQMLDKQRRSRRLYHLC